MTESELKQLVITILRARFWMPPQPGCDHSVEYEFAAREIIEAMQAKGVLHVE